MKTVVHVDHVSKMFRLGEFGSSTLTEDIRALFKKIAGKADPHQFKAEMNDRLSTGNSDYVWALKDINFEVKEGEIIGLVGRNGAGKSTLLKILSRTTSPTKGSVKIRGRVASLLEVGTGFHPDLSGRDNIFLNGAILGMRKAEIKAKFDQIVDFSGVQRYIDTPVKRYSSGMYIRLAFAVAAHLDPDILIIDEVLAVGDAEFQAKCLGKMKQASDQGRTVLFVSHNLGAVSDLCTRAIMLKNGEVHHDGPTELVIRKYIDDNLNIKLTDSEAFKDASFRRGTGQVRIEKISHIDKEGRETNEFLPEAFMRVRMQMKVNDLPEELMVSILLKSGKSKEIVTSTNRNEVNLSGFKSGDVIHVEYTFPKLSLRPGVYETYYWLGDRREETAFDVVDNLLPPVIIKLPKEQSELFTVGYFNENFNFDQYKEDKT
jgi:lipopolysaccharide transport system ATP-binding protein